MRVRLVSASDPYAPLNKGDEGTVVRQYDLPTGDTVLEVRWDFGVMFPLLLGQDAYEVIN